MKKYEHFLKECPFCGDYPRIERYQDESNFSHNIVTWHRIRCDCPANPEAYNEIESEAIADWNTRFNKEAEFLEELKESLKNNLDFWGRVGGVYAQGKIEVFMRILDKIEQLQSDKKSNENL